MGTSKMLQSRFHLKRSRSVSLSASHATCRFQQFGKMTRIKVEPDYPDEEIGSDDDDTSNTKIPCTIYFIFIVVGLLVGCLVGMMLYHSNHKEIVRAAVKTKTLVENVFHRHSSNQSGTATPTAFTTDAIFSSTTTTPSTTTTIRWWL